MFIIKSIPNVPNIKSGNHRLRISEMHLTIVIQVFGPYLSKTGQWKWFQQWLYFLINWQMCVFWKGTGSKIFIWFSKVFVVVLLHPTSQTTTNKQTQEQKLRILEPYNGCCKIGPQLKLSRMLFFHSLRYHYPIKPAVFFSLFYSTYW